MKFDGWKKPRVPSGRTRVRERVAHRRHHVGAEVAVHRADLDSSSVDRHEARRPQLDVVAARRKRVEERAHLRLEGGLEPRAPVGEVDEVDAVHRVDGDEDRRTSCPSSGSVAAAPWTPARRLAAAAQSSSVTARKSSAWNACGASWRTSSIVSASTPPVAASGLRSEVDPGARDGRRGVGDRVARRRCRRGRSRPGTRPATR